jgi:hypothetical protein
VCSQVGSYSLAAEPLEPASPDEHQDDFAERAWFPGLWLPGQQPLILNPREFLKARRQPALQNFCKGERAVLANP